MAITHTLNISAGTSGDQISSSASFSSGMEVNMEDLFPSEAETAFPLAIVRSKLKMIYVISDSEVSLITNGGAGDTFTLQAGRPLFWYEGCGIPVNTMFSADITSASIDNANVAGDASVKLRALIDPT